MTDIWFKQLGLHQNRSNCQAKPSPKSSSAFRFHKTTPPTESHPIIKTASYKAILYMASNRAPKRTPLRPPE